MSDDQELACILAPLHQEMLLLPNVAVAEVLRGQRVRASSDLPPWCVGRIMWRGVILPLLSFEAIEADGGSAPGGSPQDGVLVINRTRDHRDLGFYALLTRGTPRLLRLTAEDVDVLPEGELQRPTRLSHVQIGEDSAIIPNLSHLEDLLLEHDLATRP